MSELPTKSPAPRTVVVTGIDGPIGYEMVRRLAAAGARRILVSARSDIAGGYARDQIFHAGSTAEIDFYPLNLSEFESVRSFSNYVLGTVPTVDLLIHADAVGVAPKRLVSADGYEAHLAANFLGPFALTARLLPALIESPTPRVVTVTSVAAGLGRVKIGDLNSERWYRPVAAYLQSRLAALMIGLHLSDLSRRRDWNLTSVSAHPGHVIGDPSWRGRSIGMASATALDRIMPAHPVAASAAPLMLAAIGDVKSGQHFGPSGPLELNGQPSVLPVPRRARDSNLQAQLWNQARRMTHAILPHALG